jgi:prepilin-type N-terminal cleavage/methylation domain-containing protein
MKLNNKNGFTIIELLFSTTIFSLVLLLCLSGLIQIGRMYYKGVTTSQTQQAARTLLDEISQSIQFSAADVTEIRLPGTGNLPGPELYGTAGPIPSGQTAVGYFCVGTIRYTFAMDRMQGDTNDAGRSMIRHAMWADEPGVCAGAAASTLPPVDLTAAQPSDPIYKGRDLLSDNMRLMRLRLTDLDADDSVWRIQLTVAYGDNDLFIVDSADATRRFCRGRTIGTEFCAFSELSTIVKRRVQ